MESEVSDGLRFPLFILFPDRKLTWHFEQELRQTRRLSQSIMEIYGQESQHSMAQFLPEGLSDSYQGIVSVPQRGIKCACAAAHGRFIKKE